MRFRKGDKVEVMNNKEVPCSWRPAEILYGREHTYCVRYYFFPAMESDQLVEIVPRKLVRPLPPVQQHNVSYNAGDVVEVFYKNSWMVAVISKILGGKKEHKRKVGEQVAKLPNQFLVKLLGSSQELVIDRLNIRMRQTWHGVKWMIMGKIYQAGNDLISSKPSPSDCCRMRNSQVPQYNSKPKYQPANNCKNIQDDAALWKSALASPRSLKRISPYGSSTVEVPEGHVQKLRAIEKEGQKKRVIATSDLEKGYSWRHVHHLPLIVR